VILRAALVALALVLATAPAEAEVLHVDPTRDGAYRTVEAALDAAAPFDVIRIAAGVWHTAVEIDKSIVIEGASGGSEPTIFDGEGVRRAFTVASPDVDVTLRHLQVHNGFSSYDAGAIFVRDGAKVTVEDSSFFDCYASYDGGVGQVRHPGSVLRFERCLFRGNRSIHNAGAVNAILAARLEIVDCGFLDNSSEIISGAVAVNNGVLEVSGSVFRRNSAEHVGAIHIVEAWASVTNCTFDMNAGDVGTMLANQQSIVTVERNIFADEQRGVGLEVRRATQAVRSCNLFWSNAKGAIAGGDLGPGSRRADPRFCDPNADEPDLTLWAMSPAAAVFSACGERIGAYPVTCRLPDGGAQEVVYWDPLQSRRR